jgi:hypothetical protein
MWVGIGIAALIAATIFEVVGVTLIVYLLWLAVQ